MWRNFSETFFVTFIFFQVILLSTCYSEPFSVQSNSKSTCQELFQAEKFTISLPKKDQPDLFECKFVINAYAPDVCRLRLNFKHFVLNGAQPCRSQYLRVAGKRLCGSIFGAQLFPFPDNNTVLEYLSDGMHPLEIEVEQIRCKVQSISKSCDVTSSKTSTDISSPNYPSSYPTPVTCLYKIEAQPNICQVAIRFLEFDVSNSPGCIKGRLLIDGTSYCGVKTGLVVYKNITEKFIFDFTEGSGQSLGGFRLKIDQVPCSLGPRSSNQLIPVPPIFPPLCCSRVFSKPNFFIVSPGFLESKEPVDYSCVYRIVPSSPQICRLRLTFIHFWLGQEDIYYGCTDGFLEVDGRKYCGCKDGLSFTTIFNGGGKDLFLYMRGFSTRGFIIEIHQELCGTFADQKDPERDTESFESDVEFFSTNSTVEKFQSRFFIPSENSRCTPEGFPRWLNKIHTFSKALLNSCPTPPSSPIPPPISPVPPIFPPQPIPPPIRPVPPIFPPQPIPPPPVNPVPPIFPPPPVPPLVVPPIFTPPIVPPIAPPSLIPPVPPPTNPFPPTPPIVPPIIPYPPCPPTNPIIPPISRPTPPIAPPLYPSSRCQHFFQLQGNFESPNYPWNYPAGLKCCYRVRQAPGFCRLQVIILDFDVAWSPKCWKDYLLLDHRARYCGNSLQSSSSYIHFRNGVASIDFVSDLFFSGRGFRGFFRQIPCYSYPYLPRTQNIDKSGETIATTTGTPKTVTPTLDLNVTPV